MLVNIVADVANLSDVLAAMCLGAFIPLMISVVNDLRHRSAGGERPLR